MKKVFLGGTCNGSLWRNEFIKSLEISSYNPVVANWTPECMEKEIKERETCDFCLYTITPKMTGVYSIAEVVDDSNKRPEKTVLVILDTDGVIKFEGHQLKSLKSVASMVEKNGSKVFTTLNEAAEYMNNN